MSGHTEQEPDMDENELSEFDALHDALHTRGEMIRRLAAEVSDRETQISALQRENDRLRRRLDAKATEAAA